MGLQELEKVTEKMSELKGCCLIIDYGYLRPNNQDTLQSVMKHKKNKLLNNLGNAEVTSHVNFSLLSDFFFEKKFKSKKSYNSKRIP